MTKVKPSIANTSLNVYRRRFPLTLWVVVLLVLLLLSVLSSITFGPVDIAIPDVARILVCRIFRSEPAQYAELLQSTTADIIWNIRFPRVLMAMVVGAGLSVSGVVMQAVVRNPLADPYVLGLSSGASLVPHWRSSWGLSPGLGIMVCPWVRSWAPWSPRYLSLPWRFPENPRGTPLNCC
ncbi:iron ABC transporter permease [Flavonifractor plautii]|nr:iron ABC transporter permease [Flavonifractor plautii]